MTVARGEMRATKGEQSREKLLRAAARVLVKRGFGQTTVREIAREAGVSLGALYFYFRSKEEFATEVYEQGIKAIWEHVEKVVEALPAGTGAMERIEEAILSHVVATLTHGDYALAIRFASTSLAPSNVQRRYLQTVNHYRDFWQRLLEDAQRDGGVRTDLTVGKLLFFIFGTINWLGEWYEPNRASVESIVRDFTNLLFEGLRAPSTSDGCRLCPQHPKSPDSAENPDSSRRAKVPR